MFQIRKKKFLVVGGFVASFIFGSIITWFLINFNSSSSAYWVPSLESKNFQMGLGQDDNGISENIAPIFASDLEEGKMCNSIDPKSFLKTIWPNIKDKEVGGGDNPDTTHINECQEFIITKGNLYFIRSTNHNILSFVPTDGSSQIVMQTSTKYPANYIDSVKVNNKWNWIFLIQEGWNNPAKLITLKLK